MDTRSDEGEVTWEARSSRPVVILYVLAVFVPFMAFAHFGVHSGDAVKALFLAALGAVAATAPGILTRHRYVLSERGVSRVPSSANSPRKPRELFAWEELSYLAPTSTGFKFFKRLEETRPLRRFWKLHVAEGFSGHLYVEEDDRPRIQGAIARKDIPTTPPRAGSSLPGASRT